MDRQSPLYLSFFEVGRDGDGGGDITLLLQHVAVVIASLHDKCRYLQENISLFIPCNLLPAGYLTKFMAPFHLNCWPDNRYHDIY